MNSSQATPIKTGATYFQRVAKLILEDSLLGIILVDRNLNMVAANTRFCEIVGYRLSELEGHRFSAFSHMDDVKNEEQKLFVL